MSRATILLLALSYCMGYPDYFNYDVTSIAESSYGPADWDQVDCRNVKTCPGWPTNWDEITDFIPYDSRLSNTCMDCSSMPNVGECKTHSQSPINVERKVTAERECGDLHRMRYWAGECRMSDMRFEVLPHRLRAYRPEKNCTGNSQPQLDFSRGFPVPWLLSFTDISVPSQHTMEGKHYDAEVTLSHSFSVKKTDKLIGNLSIMLEKGGAADRYDFLDLYIEGWVTEANKAIQHCFPAKARRLVADLRSTIETLKEADMNVTSRKLADDFPLHNPRFPNDVTKPEFISNRYYNRTWNPYDWYSKANTEYYFRYMGSMPEPPCLPFAHWRILKDPIQVAPSQIRTLELLLMNRLDPVTCEYYTAGKRTGNTISVNRPIQTNGIRHQLVYCECVDWPSVSKKDIAFCELSPKERGVFQFTG